MNQAVSVRKSLDEACCFRSIRGGGVRVIWEIISKCNLDCVHCFVEHTEYGIETEDALRIIDEFPLLPVSKIMFTGGEPFLRRDMLTLVRACLAQGILVDITTNLTHMTPEKIAALREMGLHEITTSLDGPEPIHDRIRRAPGNFKRVVATVPELRAAGIAVDIVCVAQRDNADHLGETIAIAHDLGASSISISGFNHQNRAARFVDVVSLQDEQLPSVERQIRAARERYGETFPIRTVSLLQRFAGPVPCPVQNLIGINAAGQASNCLLAPVPAHQTRDVRQGLKAAWDALNRDHCCSHGGFAPLPLVTLGKTAR